MPRGLHPPSPQPRTSWKNDEAVLLQFVRYRTTWLPSAKVAARTFVIDPIAGPTDLVCQAPQTCFRLVSVGAGPLDKGALESARIWRYDRASGPSRNNLGQIVIARVTVSLKSGAATIIRKTHEGTLSEGHRRERTALYLRSAYGRSRTVDLEQHRPIEWSVGALIGTDPDLNSDDRGPHTGCG
jgi:hypothetical protein